jgi:molybdenum cofactor cytidylyltransferase
MLSVVVLAGGASSRMGRPKQNLLVDDKTLLQHALINAHEISENVVVVLGANYEIIANTINHPDAVILHNAEWSEGIASSIRTAIFHLQAYKTIRSVLFMVCDQPFTTIDFLHRLADTAEASDHGIIASGYSDTVGVPMLFKSQYFDDLKGLKGDEGAKKIAMLHPDDVLVIPFPEGSIDIDTKQDYQSFKKSGRSL